MHCTKCRAEILANSLFCTDWFTDTSAGGLRSAGGFETRDLKDAKALPEELGG
jgi:hypothetical protein